MDELLIRQLTRQLKILNVYLTIVAVITVTGFLVLGFLMYKVITFTHDVSNKVTSTENSLNVKQKACDSKGVGSFLHDKTGACN